MEELEKLKKYLPFLIPIISIFFVVFLVSMVSTSSGGDSSVMAGVFFRKPFKDDVKYKIESPFGDRLDPIGSNNIEFHSGMDLSAPSGTEIVSVADGVVYETGYSETGLGNYVYIKHNIDGIIYYSIYGHMSDDSIVVSKGDNIKMGDVIGIIGTTGNSTGIHLHFTLSSPILSFNKDYLVDPCYVIEGL